MGKGNKRKKPVKESKKSLKERQKSKAESSRSGKRVADVTQTRALHIVDAQGTVRIRCAAPESPTQGDTAVAIELLDPSGQPRLELQLDDTGEPSVRLWNGTHGLAITMSVSSDGNCILVGNKQGQPRILLGVIESSDATSLQPHADIQVVDEKGGRQWSSFAGIQQHPDA